MSVDRDSKEVTEVECPVCRRHPTADNGPGPSDERSAGGPAGQGAAVPRARGAEHLAPNGFSDETVNFGRFRPGTAREGEAPAEP